MSVNATISIATEALGVDSSVAVRVVKTRIDVFFAAHVCSLNSRQSKVAFAITKVQISCLSGTTFNINEFLGSKLAFIILMNAEGFSMCCFPLGLSPRSRRDDFRLQPFEKRSARGGKRRRKMKKVRRSLLHSRLGVHGQIHGAS